MREDQYRHLLSVGRTLVETVDPEGVLERLLEIAREITGARYAALGVLDERRERLRRFLTSGIDPTRRQEIGELPQGRGVLGELIHHPAPLRLDVVGDHPNSYGFPPGHPRMESFLGVPVVIGGEPYGNLYLCEKADGAFDEEDEEAVRVIAEWASVAIQNARLHDTVRSRRDELEKSVATLETTTSIAKALAGETDLDRVLELIAKRGRAVVEARLLLITLLTPDGVQVAAAAGEGAKEVHRLTIPPEESTTSRVLASRRSLRFTRHDAVPIGVAGGEFAGRDAETALVVPLVFRNRGIGALAAIGCLGGGAFTAEDERMLEAFADSAATAVGTAQSVSVEQRRRAVRAAEAERRRWARELHDDTLQELAAARLGLALGRRSGDVDELRATMDRAIGDLDERIASLRALIADLRPPALDELGLSSALDGLVRRVEARGIDVEYASNLAFERGEMPTRFTPEVEDAAYRLVQEALTNVLKHAGATTARVTLAEGSGLLGIDVVDDGRGLPDDRTDDGFGLVGMRERVDLLGGTLDLGPADGGGTHVRVVLPALHRAVVPDIAPPRTGS